MQLNVKNFIRGVRCDLTGEEMFDHFTYYSMTGQPFYVDQSKKLINPGPKGALDIDMSEKAFKDLWEQVRNHLGNARKDTIKCDLSDKYMTGKFTYWKIEIKQVDVEIKQVDSPGEMQASVVANDTWELSVSDEEVQKLLELQKEHCSEPFDESNAPKITTKRDVLRIPAPTSEAEKSKLDRYRDFDQMDDTPELYTGIYSDEVPEPERMDRKDFDQIAEEPEDSGVQIYHPPTPPPDEPEKPNIGHVIENNPAFFKNRVEEIISKSKKKIHPASPATPDPDIEFEPEVTKKTKLPDVGARVNIKKRNPKK